MSGAIHISVIVLGFNPTDFQSTAQLCQLTGIMDGQNADFDIFKKMIFCSIPVVGPCMNGDNLKYFYKIFLPLL